MARLRSTRRLPVREDVLQRLMKGDARLDQLEQQIADSLQQLSRLPHPSTSNRLVDAAKVVQSMEAPLLTRESHFNTYLDAAWLQSETIDLLTGEIDLLKQMAEIPSQTPVPRSAPATSASERLLQNLEQARKKRVSIDYKLNNLGSKTKSPATTGTRFDTTLE